jgi:diguanylate cyclase (GGDEF)-like protein
LNDRESEPREVLSEDAFRSALARETDRATRYQHFFSVCLIKPEPLNGSVNGHAREMQRAVAKKIAEFLRSTDVVACVADSAAILLLHTADGDAAMVAERIRAHIENVAFPVSHDGPAARVTLSVGEVSFPRDGSNDRALLTRAEANLREATRQGGNRVVHAEYAS